MGLYPPRMAFLQALCSYPNTRIIAIVFVLPLITLERDRNKVISARIKPIVIIINAKVSLASVFIDIDICTIAEKQKAENATKNTSVFFPFRVVFFKSCRKGKSFVSFWMILV